ncbi:NrfD/PsrC family molybdoenzyme membrane anchor subunit [Magnetofaba australis]|uniref:Putative polysulfide reductase NrfD n=1 Tax=Magnetofaba australis IT-1 TaxID=1434232 RepID=A0A1Y2K7N0_9PROT|nr:NrfD/PsrC family molybdoenzyme membrane anchor subunit [Magnetofaba australis]OSM05337.1 putative polysulfide reductase NrfD [Magnetofaba australis IT-1]
MISKFTAIQGESFDYWKIVGLFGALFVLGLLAFGYIEIQGHHVTGMNQKVVWGLPHVFAISLLVMASGALNLASMATVFGAEPYKQFRRFSAFLAIALLVGGLLVLIADLGRPDRGLLTMIHMNFRSMFTWNVFLYSGFVVLCFLYLWSMMEHEKYVKITGSAAFPGRVILTTGTGSIFGVIHAREVFHSAITGPTFIAVSLSSGTAICFLLLASTFKATGREFHPKLISGMRNMLIFFTLAVFYLIVVEKFTKSYSPAFYDVEKWVLTGQWAWLFWGGIVLAGIVAPLAILTHKTWGNSLNGVMLASGLAIIGEVSFIAHVLLAGQTYPFNPFPGYVVSSSFQDGAFGHYVPSLSEFMLGMGGVGVAGLIYLLGIKFFRLLPKKAEAPEHWAPWNP